MPHVLVKIASGRSMQEKSRLAEAISHVVTTTLNISEETISVAIEDVPPEDWAEKVYKPEIIAKSERLFKKPGYTL